MTEQSVPPTAKELRQLEIDAYKKNIDIYTALLATLDNNWDTDLIQFKDLDNHEAARRCPLDRLDRLSVLLQYEQISNLLRTETLEYNKSKAILNIL